MNSYQHIEDAVKEEKASVVALNEAKETERRLLESGKLFSIKRGSAVILTTYPQKYDEARS